ncbi:MAG TPA: S9 family peptidase, partial [Caldithrix sp.]|nr:S9 family peptidase [Caldithrix sp.]
MRNGYRWSPNGKKIAYWQLDASGVGEFYLINNTDSLYPKIIPVQYPKAGTTNSACRVGVVSANGGETTWLQVPGNPRNNYITRMEWAANSDEVLIQHLNRRQNRLEVLFGDAQTGAVKTAFVEQDSAWVEVVNDVKWLREGREFTWVSERDGWRHVYRVSRKDGTLRLITPGNFDIIQIACVGEKQGWLYYIASPENAGQRYLYRSRLSGKDAPQRLTPEQFKGTNSYQISPNAKWAFHTYSTFETPPMVNLIRLPQHKVTKQLLKNEKLRRKIAALKRKPVRFFQVAIADSVSLDAWEMQPYNFNPAKKYPVLFFIYGEPAGQTVLDRWRKNRYLWHLMLTQQEYIVMSVDNRGTPAP